MSCTETQSSLCVIARVNGFIINTQLFNILSWIVTPSGQCAIKTLMSLTNVMAGED